MRRHASKGSIICDDPFKQDFGKRTVTMEGVLIGVENSVLGDVTCT